MRASAWVRSSIGRKALMALSGLALVGFVIGHLLGNLQIFLGPDTFNAYAAKLEHLGPLLWVVRAGLLALIAVHIVTSIQLTLENRAARPEPYAAYRPAATTLAARTMIGSGVLLLAFLIYHLLHFTFRVTNPEISHGLDALGRRDVYTMAVRSFQQLPIAIAYGVGMAALCFHLGHGIGSAVQSLGLNNERTLLLVTRLGWLLALLLALGYCAVPGAVLTGVVG